MLRNGMCNFMGRTIRFFNLLIYCTKLQTNEQMRETLFTKSGKYIFNE